MEGAQLAMFAALVAVVVGIWVTVFYLLPLIARARFEYRATVVRDACLDAVLDGRLRRSAPVESFLTRASAMAARPKLFTLTRAMAVHLAMTELGCDEVKAPTYGSLKPEERKLMHELDEQLNQALGERLLRGSAFGWLLWGTLGLLRLVLRSKPHRNAVSAASPQHLAREYSAISETVPIKGRRLAGSISQLD